MNLHRAFRFRWSETKFCRWLLSRWAVQRPLACSSEEWKQWHQQASKFFAYHFVYFLDSVQDGLTFPLDVLYSIRVYVRNRFINRIHYLPTRLEKGCYYDIDTRMVHGLFETLVDYVEVELAHMQQFVTSECTTGRIDGLRYLDSGISNTSDSEHEQQIKDLYLWWKDIRPKRVYDSYDKIKLYDAEDTEMMIKLIQMRGGLWT